jgi:hypothetical protein
MKEACDGSSGAPERSGEEGGFGRGRTKGKEPTGAVMMARKLLCQVAVRKFGYTGASEVRFLWTTTWRNLMVRLQEVREGARGDQ